MIVSGHAVYVWGAYGLALLVMVVEPLLAWRRHRRALGHARGDDRRRAR